MINEINELERFEMPQIGVYFLFREDNLIYIGKSINIFQRIHQHLKDKYFDNYSFIKCDHEFEANELEKKMIIKYRPDLNIRHKTADLNNSIEIHLKSIKLIKKEKQLFNIK